MKPSNDGGAAAAAARHITTAQFKAFYDAEYPKLVKVLRAMGATREEAEDAAQKAMADFDKRARCAQAPIRRPDAYVCRAAIRFFVKERERDRKRRPCEVQGGQLALPACLDDGLTAWEDRQWVEHVLESLTPAQRDVIELVMDGADTHEIAKELGKTDVTIRQLRKTGRDRLRAHPEIARSPPRSFGARNPAAGGVRPAATPTPRKDEEVQ